MGSLSLSLYVITMRICASTLTHTCTYLLGNVCAKGNANANGNGH